MSFILPDAVFASTFLNECLLFISMADAFLKVYASFLDDLARQVSGSFSHPPISKWYPVYSDTQEQSPWHYYHSNVTLKSNSGCLTQKSNPSKVEEGKQLASPEHIRMTTSEDKILSVYGSLTPWLAKNLFAMYAPVKQPRILHIGYNESARSPSYNLCWTAITDDNI